MRNVVPASITMWFSVAHVSLPSSTITVVSNVNAGPVTARADCGAAISSVGADVNAAIIRAWILFTVPPTQDCARSDHRDRKRNQREPG